MAKIYYRLIIKGELTKEEFLLKKGVSNKVRTEVLEMLEVDG